MTRNGDKHEFRWESGYDKTWSVIREDESGQLITSLEQLIHDAHDRIRRKKRCIGVGSEGFVKLGMMRHLYLILDLSEAMREQDLKPNRLICTIKLACNFVEDYFDQNPISQLGIILTSNRRAERLTELSGNPRPHLLALQSLYTRVGLGEPSLKNALELAESRLKYAPHHCELVILMANLTTCDSGDVYKVIQSLANYHIKCNVIMLSVEVFLYRSLAQITGGTFNVVIDELHLKTLLKELVHPPFTTVETEAMLIRMGFPHSESYNLDQFPSKLCMCHLSTDQLSSPATTTTNTSMTANETSSTTIAAITGNATDNSAAREKPTPQYACPRCRAAYCDLPVECTVCGLTLVAAPHLARAYHHLFPLDSFESVKINKDQIGDSQEKTRNAISVCTGCNVSLSQVYYECPKCKSWFCHTCDAVLHDSVHSCPGCVHI